MARLWIYRILVSDHRVPLWRQAATRGIAYHEHLYTRIAAAGESDAIERWLDADFEAPAEEVIDKVVNERRLTPTDWKVLARFFAVQDVRTPARLLENMARWSETLPEVMHNVMVESLAEYEKMTPDQRRELQTRPPGEEGLPFRVRLQRREGKPGGWLKGETVSGRGLWLWSMRQVLSDDAEALRALLSHRWTILVPPDGEEWFTSDDPALKVNFNILDDYTFGGGWGSVGTDLLLPLGPRHLLYTQVGRPVPPRGSRMDRQRARIVHTLLARHAHRYIFAASPDRFVEQVRCRTVDAAELARETKEWQRWHAEQSEAERSVTR